MPARPSVQPALDEVPGTGRPKFDEALGEFRERAQAVAHEAVEGLRSQARPYVDTAGERLSGAERYIVERVQKQPLTTTFAALGVGVLLGLLLSGGRSR